MRAKRKGTSDLQSLERARALRPILAECLANNFASFVRKAWNVLYPHRKLVWSWHYDYLCEVLTLVKEKKILRLIVNVPPRTLKSTLITVLFPAWGWTTNPEHEFLTASYALDLSLEHSLMRRALLQSRWFRELWGDKVQLAGDRNQAAQYMNTRRGQMIASSVGGTLMGKGFDTAILDDLVSPMQSASDAERTTANNWLDNTCFSRANDPSTAAIIIVMQRLHVLDPVGYVMRREPNVWRHECFPLIAETDQTWNFPISGQIVQRKAGEVLLPTHFTPEVVEQLRSRRLVFASQYQQRPVPLEGNLIKRTEVRYYGGIDPRTSHRTKNCRNISTAS